MKKCWEIIWLSIGISAAVTICLSAVLYNRRKLREEFDLD